MNSRATNIASDVINLLKAVFSASGSFFRPIISKNSRTKKLFKNAATKAVNKNKTNQNNIHIVAECLEIENPPRNFKTF